VPEIKTGAVGLVPMVLNTHFPPHFVPSWPEFNQGPGKYTGGPPGLALFQPGQLKGTVIGLFFAYLNATLCGRVEKHSLKQATLAKILINLYS
jgi:hypothetical protein